MAKYLINSVTKAQTKGGKTYLRMQLFEPGGKVHKSVCWEDKDVKSGQVIDALAEEDSFGGEPQLNIKAMRVINSPDAVDDFLPRTPYSIDGLLEEAQKMLTDITNKHLYVILREILNDTRWRRAAAAKALHHAYLGGLLEHSVNIARLAYKVAELYQELRRDYLVAGAFLHDVGKMDEISSGVTFEYTDEGQLLGHVGIGLLRVDHLMDADPEGFGTYDKPSELRMIVRHLIASHHGNVSYGAIKTPATMEAQVLSCLDGIDAHMGKMRSVIEKVVPGTHWTFKANWETPQLYVGEK